MTSIRAKKRRRRHQAKHLQLVARARELLTFSGLGSHPDSASRLIREAPPEWAEDYPLDGFCAFCVATCPLLHLSDERHERFLAVARFWLDEVPRWDAQQRARLEPLALSELLRRRRAGSPPLPS